MSYFYKNNNNYLLGKMLQSIKLSCEKYGERNAFCINKKYYTYIQFAQCVSNIRKLLDDIPEKFIGIITNDDLETYASIFAVMFSSKTFIPINPENPADRNNAIVELSRMKVLLSSSDNAEISKTVNTQILNLIITTDLENTAINLRVSDSNPEEIAYILFTSGSTGTPKGVPISRENLYSFVDAFFDLGYELDENDRFLQMFDLTFDLSLMSYIIPLCKGACTYTIPPDEIKYMYIFSLMEDNEITVALMVPSILAFLRPYFDDIRLDKMKYSLFCGEALYDDLVKEWAECVPNALIQNVYGPTEATIFCITYDCKENTIENKSFNSIVCIGKPMNGVDAIIIDDNQNIAAIETKGELCLSGLQLTEGYWKNPEKNMESFFKIDYKGSETVFYKSGDLCFIDEDDDFMYCGRIDNQVQIQGFRVELNEIEHHVRDFAGLSNIAAVAYQNKNGNTQINLFIDKCKIMDEEIEKYLNSKLPPYMIPTEITRLDSFPLNINGKIDRKALKKTLEG